MDDKEAEQSSGNPWFDSLPDELQRNLQSFRDFFVGPSACELLWNKADPDERDVLGGDLETAVKKASHYKGYKNAVLRLRIDVMRVWMDLHGVPWYSALVELARKVEKISEGEYVRLTKELARYVDDPPRSQLLGAKPALALEDSPQQKINDAANTHCLLLVLRACQVDVYWDGAIRAERQNADGKPIQFLLAWAGFAKADRELDWGSRLVTDNSNRSPLKDAKGQLVSQFPFLRPHIKAVKGKYRASELGPDDIAILEFDGLGGCRTCSRMEAYELGEETLDSFVPRRVSMADANRL